MPHFTYKETEAQKNVFKTAQKMAVNIKMPVLSMVHFINNAT